MTAADVLAESGFRVLEAENAVEALDLLARFSVAVLFTDINMPGPINGLELTEIVAARYPRMRVIITSGMHRLSEEEMPDRGVYLPKPYRSNQLASVVEQQAAKYG
jgi:DNA-binding NtrC family response regulator